MCHYWGISWDKKKKTVVIFTAYIYIKITVTKILSMLYILCVCVCVCVCVFTLWGKLQGQRADTRGQRDVWVWGATCETHIDQ
jgi:hypothetical protein